MILLKQNGDVTYGRTRADKDALVADFQPEDLMLWAWVGSHHTDIFLLTQQDINQCYR